MYTAKIHHNSVLGDRIHFILGSTLYMSAHPQLLGYNHLSW